MGRCAIICVALAVLVLVTGCASYHSDPRDDAYVAMYRAERNQAKLWDIEKSPAQDVITAPIDKALDQGSVVHEMVVATEAGEHWLRMPARIGYARLGAIYPLKPSWQNQNPVVEVDLWRRISQKLSDDVGKIVPVVDCKGEKCNSIELYENEYSPKWSNISLIRRAASDQKLDAVVIYRTMVSTNYTPTLLSFLNFTIVGAFVIPSQIVEVQAISTAIIMDVRNGSIYDMATASAGKMRMSDSFSTDAAMYSSEHVAYSRAIRQLEPAIAEMLTRMYIGQLSVRAGIPL